MGLCYLPLSDLLVHSCGLKLVPAMATPAPMQLDKASPQDMQAQVESWAKQLRSGDLGLQTLTTCAIPHVAALLSGAEW